MRSLNGYIKESILDTTDTDFDAVLAILASGGSISADDLKIIRDFKNPRNPKSGRADNIELVLSKVLPSTTKIVLKK